MKKSPTLEQAETAAHEMRSIATAGFGFDEMIHNHVKERLCCKCDASDEDKEKCEAHQRLNRLAKGADKSFVELAKRISILLEVIEACRRLEKRVRPRKTKTACESNAQKKLMEKLWASGVPVHNNATGEADESHKIIALADIVEIIGGVPILPVGGE